MAWMISLWPVGISIYLSTKYFTSQGSFPYLFFRRGGPFLNHTCWWSGSTPGSVLNRLFLAVLSRSYMLLEIDLGLAWCSRLVPSFTHTLSLWPQGSFDHETEPQPKIETAGRGFARFCHWKDQGWNMKHGCLNGVAKAYSFSSPHTIAYYFFWGTEASGSKMAVSSYSRKGEKKITLSTVQGKS